MLYVKRHPGTSVLILRECYAVVSVVIALGPKIGYLWQGTPLKILREETVGATDGGVSMVVGGETNGYWRIMGCNYKGSVSVDEWR